VNYVSLKVTSNRVADTYRFYANPVTAFQKKFESGFWIRIPELKFPKKKIQFFTRSPESEGIVKITG
jgi:hypothetical protein